MGKQQKLYVNVLLNTSLPVVLAEVSRLSELPKLPSKILLGPKTMQQQYQPMFLAPLEAQELRCCQSTMSRQTVTVL